MLNITPFSQFCVSFDQKANYIAGLSTITNLTDLFLKYVVAPFVSKATLERSHYFTYLETKSLLHCVVLLVPILGNVLVAITNTFGEVKSGELVSLANCLDLAKYLDYSKGEAARLSLYRSAALYKTPEALYKLGECYCIGLGLDVAEGNLGERYMRQAAALGHLDAQKKLRHLDEQEKQRESAAQKKRGELIR